MFTEPNLLAKWKPILEHSDLPAIKDKHRSEVTCQILENTARSMTESGGSDLMEADAASTSVSSGISVYDPVLITLIRRALPNLIAYDVCGVQPMTGPTGLIFALVPSYGVQANAGNSNSTSTVNAFYFEPNTAYSTVVGTANSTPGTGMVGTSGALAANTLAYNYAMAMATAQGEALGTTGNSDFSQMAVSVQSVQATARTRALKSEYTIEMAQDLKAIHGLDAETELANILSVEILAEINREIIRTINISALQGAVEATSPGTFDLDVDSDGRWSVEKFKGLNYQIERECNAVAKATRRGRGNLLICSSDVASALQQAGILDFAPAMQGNDMQVDDTGPTFAGVLNGRIRVFIDPYTTGDYFTVGYRGANPIDAGIFYSPYVPLQMVRGVNPDSLQPKIGFKSRYAVVANPFAPGSYVGDGTVKPLGNVFYRSAAISHLL